MPNNQTQILQSLEAQGKLGAISMEELSTPRKVGDPRIGPYILGRTLGVGTTGRVKLATHFGSGRKVAIKIITKSQDPQDLLKLEREITIMKLINHPNIMQLYDVYESKSELYLYLNFRFLVLELVEGGELFDYLVKKGRLGESEALSVFHQIIHAVDFCHQHHVCHRDLKPENLLLDKHRNVKIADFGLAGLQKPSEMLSTSCGSPHYAAPEVISGKKYNGPSADVWSCGVILYALVAGRLPFDDQNFNRLLAKVSIGIYDEPQNVNQNCAALIKGMLCISPEKRLTVLYPLCR
jgi:serine/threonine protein kinase